MSTIAFLGLGAMGSRMAARLVQNGHQVSVWNRSSAPAQELARLGARVAASPREAAVGADFVISMLRDDVASRQVWLHPDTGALGGMKSDAVAIESSTLSHAYVVELGTAVQAAGHSFLEAPVSGSRPQADAGQLIYFVAGEASLVKVAEPVLMQLGSAVHHVGQVGSAAITKLVTNALLGIQVTAMAELLGIMQRHGVDANRVLGAVSATVVCSPFAARAADGMLAGAFSPQFPVELVAKDLAYVLASAGETTAAPTIAAAHQVFSEAEQAGLGQQHMTSVVKLFR